ncbi:NAD(P)-binding domain-containing protein [Arthrobacter sp. NEB 688]|uniref:NADPH-dependent F420 reductase n=1 Tax=Arthrobacter sp. NEB 688 TaxID=904039 RepID=UPI0015667C19|nr:NAD(P)-binding domain-containing protein [Arthrobacter sp. NEB 688]QKE82746.1 NAD(P)-binding domain-containing protein [Arthrobacter sp. NEB 688]
MTAVTIIGAGSMGSAIAALAEKGGSSVQVLGRDGADQAVTGDVVVLAVPYPALREIATARSAELAGKVVVDITNPLDFQTFDALVVPADSSAAAELAALLPDSHVVKAFNTNFVATLTSGEVAGRPTTVLVAGDDADAKATLAEVVTAAGLRAVDAGSLRRARELEALGFVQLTLAVGEKTPWTGGFALEA